MAAAKAHKAEKETGNDTMRVLFFFVLFVTSVAERVSGLSGSGIYMYE